MAKKTKAKTAKKKPTGRANAKKATEKAAKKLPRKMTAKVSASKAAAPKKMVKKSSNRRKFRRYPAPSLWVTELSGDYQFVVNASDISEGGIFLKSRMKTSSAPSQLTLHLGNHGSLEVLAKPIHDRVSGDSYGAGYEFTGLSATQLKALRGFLRNLD